MKRVLITGASGFIGRHCLDAMAIKDYDVHAVSRRPPESTNAAVTWHQADLLDYSQIAPLLDKVQPTHLLHLAWIVTPGESYTSLDNFRWVQSSLTLAEEFVRIGGRRMVVSGSCYEYDQRYGLLQEALTPSAADTAYGACKNALHDLLTAYCQLTDLCLAWPRIFFLYGPHEHPRRLASSVVCSLLNGEQARCSHGRQQRDYLYVEDVAEALAAITDSDMSGPVNIGQGAPLTLREIVECIAEQIGRPELLALGALEARPNEVPLIVADTTRINVELGWQPRFSLEEGVARTVAWWRATLGIEANDVSRR